MKSNLTLGEFDWLREIQGADDAKRDSPHVPMNVAGKLDAFGFTAPNDHGRSVITVKGREALLDQHLRDAEDR